MRFPAPFRWLLVGSAAAGMGGGVFVPCMALYLTRELGASGAQAGAIWGVMGMAGLVGAPLGGVLADRVGRRPTMSIGLAAIALWFLAFGSAPNITFIAFLLPSRSSVTSSRQPSRPRPPT
jgi:MFS family permease